MGQLLQCAHAVVRLGARNRTGAGLDISAIRISPVLLERGLDVHVEVPYFEVRLRRELGHRLSIGPRSREHDLPPILLAEAVLARGHLEAGAEALDVPLERAADRLVEVVD